MTKRLAIIPARGGSKRIANKNIKDFCGKPMISYILSAAKESNLFSTIHVSTESQVISKISTQLGFNPDFLRKLNLADDFSTLRDVILYVVEEYSLLGQDYDEVWLLMATAPLVTFQDLLSVSEFFSHKTTPNPVKAITNFDVPIEWAEKLLDSGVLEPDNPDALNIRSQDLDPKYYDAGLFYIYNKSNIKELMQNSLQAYQGFLMPRIQSIDIDTEDDWLVAEAFYKSLNS